MSRYIKSKIDDRTCFDTGARNMIRDILILWGIYEDYIAKHKPVELDAFKEHYLSVLSKASNNSLCDFKGELHYFNRGKSVLKDLSTKKTIPTSGIRIRRMCNTYQSHRIFLPKNAAAILNVLFERVYDDTILKKIFLENILTKCMQYTNDIKKYPYDCSYGILGFVGMFLNNINVLDYSKRYKDTASHIYETMERIAEKFNLQDLCGRRKL